MVQTWTFLIFLRYGPFVSQHSMVVRQPDVYSSYADKEVEGYYDDGMTVPDYVTLLWSDDK